MSCEIEGCSGCRCFSNPPCNHCVEDHDNLDGKPECIECGNHQLDLNDDGICSDCVVEDLDYADCDFSSRSGYSQDYINYLNKNF